MSKISLPAFAATVVMVGICSDAFGQTLEDFVRDPRIEKPVPVCVVHPIFCEPGFDPSSLGWQPSEGRPVVELEGMSLMLGGEDGIIVVDPSRVYLGVDGVYIVPNGVENPFENR